MKNQDVKIDGVFTEVTGLIISAEFDHLQLEQIPL